MDDFDLSVIDPDDEGWPTPPPPEPTGRVDMTVRLSDGAVWRVATVGGQVRLTSAGPDGMATLSLGEQDADILAGALHAGQMDLQRTRHGRPW